MGVLIYYYYVDLRCYEIIWMSVNITMGCLLIEKVRGDIVVIFFDNTVFWFHTLLICHTWCVIDMIRSSLFVQYTSPSSYIDFGLYRTTTATIIITIATPIWGVQIQKGVVSFVQWVCQCSRCRCNTPSWYDNNTSFWYDYNIPSWYNSSYSLFYMRQQQQHSLCSSSS